MKEIVSREGLKHLRRDLQLRPYLDAISLPKRDPAADVYSGLIRSIVSQQLSVKAASTIYGRFLSLFTSGYPHATELLDLHDDTLRSAGISRQKTKYVRSVAEYFMRPIDIEALPSRIDHSVLLHATANGPTGDSAICDWRHMDWTLLEDEEIIDILTQIKGVGRWTVEMILMFVLKRKDIFPVADLGIQQGVQHVYQFEIEKKELKVRMREIAEKWRPYRSLACLYLWEVDKSIVLG